MFKGYSVKY